jgi:hypothetical protein
LDSLINILFKPFFLLINFLKAKENFAFFLVILVNLVTRLIVIDVADLGLNETVAISESNSNPFGFSPDPIGYSVFEPVYKLIMFCWIKIVSFSVYGMRTLDALFMSVAAGLVFKNINKYIDFRVACWIALFFYINNVLLFHSQDVGNSSLALLLAVVSTFNFVEFYQDPTNRKAIKVGLINCILFYVSNAFVCLSLIQLVFLLFSRRSIKAGLISFLAVVVGCNYFLVRYFTVNDLLAHQLNLGLYWENVIKLFHLNFADYFFFNLLFWFTLAIVLNIFIKKLNRRSDLTVRFIPRYFVVNAILCFVFILKSRTFLNHDLEIPAIVLFSLALSVLLGLLFGLQTFSSKINLLVYVMILFVFLPSLQLGATKRWHSKALIKVINRHQNQHTAFICNNYLPFLFYLAPEDFRKSEFKSAEYQLKNILNIKNLTPEQIKTRVSAFDTIIYIDHEKSGNSNVDSFLVHEGYMVGTGDKIYDNYKLKTFYKN